MAAFWGVEPYQMPMIDNTDELLVRVEEMMKTERQAKPGDEIIVVMGSPAQNRAETNLIKFHRIR